MQVSYKDFIENIKNKSVLFYGLSRSNMPLANMLAKENIKVTVYDDKSEEKFSKTDIEKLKSTPDLSLRLADKKVWDEYFDIIIRTPGISYFEEKIVNSRKKGSIITSEMEIFFDLCPCPIIGITGSDGKTTITTIVYEMLKESGFTVHLGGNIGFPLLPNINSIKKTDIAVVELSSFQLMSMRRSPEIAIISNISPNHLDFHKTIEEYIESKKQILIHQNAFSKAVLNFENEETKNMDKISRGETLFFSSKRKLDFGTWVDENGNIFYSENGKDTFILNKSEIKVPGNHNLENFLAAISSVFKIANTKAIKKVAENFNGVNHRIEFVRKVNGVSYYNDSIASTPTRTIKGALSLFEGKITLIAGGYDKKVPFDSLAKEIVKKVSTLILMGNSADKILNEITRLKDYSEKTLKIIKVDSMENAVEEAKNNSKIGDIVVLSPACASFDLYKNFEERGNHFKSLVNKIVEDIE